MADSTPSEKPKERTRSRQHEWDDKKNICFKLYVEQKKTPAEIVKYFADLFKVDERELPHFRAFSRQFKIWGFPHRIRKLTKEEEPLVIARLRELWAQNVMQKDMKQIIADEGFYVNHHVFSRLWRDCGLKLRAPNREKQPAQPQQGVKRKADELTEQTAPDEDRNIDPSLTAASGARPSSASAPAVTMSSEQQMQRAQRMAEVQAASNEQFDSRKRRRRIRGFAHLPPDAPGTAPRYASETSLDECKAFLHFTNDLYDTVRDEYEAIAKDMGIIKKTQCEPGAWEESKRRLIQGNVHLSAVLHPFQPEQDRKAVALECLCCDVLKRIRSQSKMLSIPGANNVLAINPAQSKAIRQSFYNILVGDGFESRLICGNEHWAALRSQWYDTSDTLQEAITEQDPAKLRAVERLVKEVIKRYNDDKQKSTGNAKSKATRYGPGPGPAFHGSTTHKSKSNSHDPTSAVVPSIAPSSNPEAAQVHAVQSIPTSSAMPERRLPEVREPRVHAAAVDHYLPQASGNVTSPIVQTTGDVDFGADPIMSVANALQSDLRTTAGSEGNQSSKSVPAYFRLAHESQLTQPHPRVWLAKITSTTVGALHTAALSKTGAMPARIIKVEGSIKDEHGAEDRWPIDTQDELEAYLGETVGKATFVVTLENY